jgi:pimeloyl-ACP methyl ester carboxylesterase
VRARGSRRIAALAACALLVATLAVSDLLVSTDAVGAAESAPPSVDWEPCGAPFECATVAVPVDYGDPAGPTLGLAVARAHARDGPRRIGSLVVNPGGPGAPGIPYLRSLIDSIPGELRDRFDLVSFDPRGVGDSGAVKCGADIDPLFDQSFSPANAAERSALVAAFRAVVDACARDSGALLPHVSTVDTARDLDFIRAAVGDRTLTYVGESYGTYLGTIYATLFPERVRAIVLDGAIDPTADGTAVALGQARGFEGALDDFLADCAKQRGCAFYHDGEPGAAFDALRARAERTGLPTVRNADRTVNGTRFDAAVIEGLYAGRAGWRSLGEALARAEDGDASTLLAMADGFVGRTASGMEHDALDAFWAISCLDGPLVGDVDAAARLQALATRAAPRLGAFLVNFSLACSIWPVPPVTAPAPLDAAGAPPLLVVGTTGDPATPLASAQSLRRQLERSALLVAVGEQHTSFGVGNECADRVVTRYLVDRTLPGRAKRC